MVNKVILIGNLGQDPDLKYTPSGTAVATLSVATSRSWKDKDGQKQDETEWHRVIVWDKAAEFCGNYLKKGGKVYVEGRLATRKWEKDGVTMHTTEIIAATVQNLTPRSADDQQKDPTFGQHGFDQTTGEEVPF